MKRVISIFLFLGFFLLPGVGAAQSEKDAEALTAPLFETLSLDTVNQFVREMNGDFQGKVPELTASSVMEFSLKGFAGGSFDFGRFIMEKLTAEGKKNLLLLGKILVLAVFCALLQNIENSFERSGISLLCQSLCFAFLSVMALHIFYEVVLAAGQTVDRMVGFMEALLPVLLSLLTAVGAFTSAALFTPLMLFIVNATSSVVKDVVLPLLIFSTVLECVNYLAGKYRLVQLASLLKQGALVILGLLLIVFIGFVTVQGAAGGVADSVSLRTAKFAAGTFIPVVGKMFADTVEVVMSASLLLKNGVGIFGLFVIFLLCLLPLLKLLSLIITIKLAGALVEPLGDAKLAACLQGIGNNLLLIFGAVLAVTLMFFLVITMLIGVGNLALLWH